MGRHEKNSTGVPKSWTRLCSVYIKNEIIKLLSDHGDGLDGPRISHRSTI